MRFTKLAITIDDTTQNIKMNSKDKYIGHYTERIEDDSLLVGLSTFVDDVHLDHMLYAFVLRSTVAHGFIKEIKTDKAKTFPGVHAIYTGFDIAVEFNHQMPTIPIRLAPIEELKQFKQPIIAHEIVRYVGEPLAIIIADSLEKAQDASEAIEVDIEARPVVNNWRSSAENLSVLHPQIKSNIGTVYHAKKGQINQNTSQYFQRKEVFKVHRHTAVTLETRGLVANWDEDLEKMTVYGATKVPFFNRACLGETLQISPEKIDMIEVAVGGGFGVRGEFYPEDFLVPYSSKKLKRPIKWIEDRTENLLGTNHSREVECEMEITCEANGKIVSLVANICVDAGAYARTSVTTVPRNSAQFSSGPYDIPNIDITSTVYLTNKCPIGSYRAPGRFECDFFRERMFDLISIDLGIDRVDFRRMNLVKFNQMPYPLARIDNPDRYEELDCGNYQTTFDRCLKEFNWEEKSLLQGQKIDGKYHGIAIGCFIEGGGAGVKETAKIEVNEDGKLNVYVGSANLGQGIVTVMTQIAAEELDVSMSDIQIFHGSTTYLEEGFGSYHSRATIMGGSAVLIVAKALKEKIKEVAASYFQCSPQEIDLLPGLISSFKNQTLDLSKLGRDTLFVAGEFPCKTNTYAYGCAAAHVSVDEDTGKVELIDYFTIEDIGRIINPLTAKGQAIGAVVQGLGGVFLENLTYDDQCQLTVGSLADYLLPTATDFPIIRAMELEEHPSQLNPLGVKGAGEGGIIPVAGLMANAVSNALSSKGVQVTELPLSPQAVWKLMQ
ncbi:MAG: xanthine dehydrogenase family protein molybdopterin-binding subunit [Betaproteobacteria bacterium]|jgi:carbon-monoxide dehydrogenase large subunit